MADIEYPPSNDIHVIKPTQNYLPTSTQGHSSIETFSLDDLLIPKITDIPVIQPKQNYHLPTSTQGRLSIETFSLDDFKTTVKEHIGGDCWGIYLTNTKRTQVEFLYLIRNFGIDAPSNRDHVSIDYLIQKINEGLQVHVTINKIDEIYQKIGNDYVIVSYYKPCETTVCSKCTEDQERKRIWRYGTLKEKLGTYGEYKLSLFAIQKEVVSANYKRGSKTKEQLIELLIPKISTSDLPITF